MLPVLRVNLLILKVAMVSQMTLQSYISCDDHRTVFRHVSLSLFNNHGIQS